MTLPEHPVSARLALLALCGELVVAIDAMSVREIRRAAETAVRRVERGVSVLDLDGELVAGWDLGELLGIDSEPSAWVVVELAGRAVAFRVGRCVVVHALPVCRALPHGIFTRRPHAFAAAFSTAGIPELADHVSGVYVDLARVLGEGELAAFAGLAQERAARVG